MKYIISKEEIKELVYDTSYYRDINVNALSEEEIIEEFLRFKSPATEIIEGKLTIYKFPYFNNHEVFIDATNLAKLMHSYAGKNIKIYVEEVK